MDNHSFSYKVIKGGIWVTALKLFNKGFGFIRLVVLARLLAPEDFGLFGIAILALKTLETFSVTGIEPALIQKKENVNYYLNTAWSIQVLRGCLLGCILFVISPLAADFFNEQKATMLIQVVALSVILRDFKNIGVVLFKKEIEFHKEFIFQFSGVIADLVVSIMAAIILKNAWALIFGLLAGNTVRLVSSYVLHPYRPSFKMDWGKAKELFTFGRWVFFSAILFFIAIQGDKIIVGKIVGTIALGIYMLAFQISDMATTEVMRIVSTLMFPVFSKVQDNIIKLREGFLRTFNLTAFIVIPITAGILLIGGEFVVIVLGQKWIPMIPVFKILAIAGLVRAFIGTPLFYAVGKPNIEVGIQFLRALVMGILIIPLTIAYGITGAGIAVLCGLLAAIPIWWIGTIRIIRLPWYTLPGRIIDSFIGTAIMSSGIIIVNQWISVSDIITFSIKVSFGIILYIGFHFLLFFVFQKGALENMDRLRKSAMKQMI